MRVAEREKTLGERVVVGVCTYGRPVMLADCLESLALQSVPADLSLSIVVVDNEAQPNRRQLVEDFGGKSPFRVYYVHQPQRGIARARNATLDKAMELRADWIAMLDDDETAAPDWIAELMAPEYRDTPVLMGEQVIVYPHPLPFWARIKRYRERHEREGTEQSWAHTNNVRFSKDLVEAGLRFDEGLGLMGGEDAVFFAHAHLRGFTIKHTARAVTFEFPHPERFTFFGQVYRAYWTSAAEVRRRLLLDDPRSVYLDSARQLPVAFLEGTLGLLGSPVRAIKSTEKFKRRVVSSAKQVASAAGTIAGLIRILPRPYRKVIGR